MNHAILVTSGNGWAVVCVDLDAIQFSSSDCCDDCAVAWMLHIGLMRRRARYN